MNVTDTQALLAAINFALCMGIVWSCSARAKVMHEHDDTALSWRVRYAVLFGIAIVSAFSPLVLGEWPGVGQVLISGAILAIIGCGGSWAGGAPRYARKPHARPSTQ